MSPARGDVTRVANPYLAGGSPERWARHILRTPLCGWHAPVMDPLILNIEQLRRAVGRVLDAAAARYGQEMRIDVDYYWNVPIDQAYNPSIDPELDMGQVSDDAQSVGDFAAGSADDPVAVWHECQHIAGVLRAIARTDLDHGAS